MGGLETKPQAEAKNERSAKTILRKIGSEYVTSPHSESVLVDFIYEAVNETAVISEKQESVIASTISVLFKDGKEPSAADLLNIATYINSCH